MSTDSDSVCVEPALILEEAAREFERELEAQRTQRTLNDVKVLSREQDQFLERCWQEFQATSLPLLSETTKHHK